ncbi:hypothetical protein DFJ74DRAFT_712157 [Hyaloraphidium curvatum]|nr:hypothetical protein DFJ74DRAFT_712157 [Hyaloraphidium curvatum]
MTGRFRRLAVAALGALFALLALSARAGAAGAVAARHPPAGASDGGTRVADARRVGRADDVGLYGRSAREAEDAPGRSPRLGARAPKKTTAKRRKTTARRKKTTTRRKTTAKRKTTTRKGPKATTTALPTSNTTSFALIQDDLASGRLTKQQAALYSVFAQFDDPQLPGQYRIGPTTVPAGGADSPHAIVDLLGSYASLSAAQKASVNPYFVPPYHGGSFWQKRFVPGSPNGSRPTKRELRLRARSDGLTADHLDGGRNRLAARVGPTDPLGDPTLMLREWDSVISTDGNVRIWYQVRYAATDRPQANAMAAEVPKIWNKHKALMGRTPPRDGGSAIDGRGGDDKLDISLVDGGSNTLPYGRSCTSAAPPYIMFNRAVAATVAWPQELAHELFHAFQYAFKVKTDCLAIDYRWLAESTAQWAEDYVYPGNSDQHRAAQYWMDQPSVSLDDDSKIGSPRNYAGYLVWHYANLVLGSPSLVASAWTNAGSNEIRDALDATFPGGGLKEHWPRIALHAFNLGQVAELRTRGLQRRPAVFGGGQNPVQFSPNGDATFSLPIPVDLPYLSASYLYLAFSDPNVRSFVFYNGLRTNLEQRTVSTNSLMGAFDAFVFEEKGDTAASHGAAIWAMWKVAGRSSWEQPEEWTDRPFARFCLQKKAEKLEELVVVFSNWEFKDRSYRVKKYGASDPVVFASDLFCHTAKGSARLDGTFNGGGTWVADGTGLQLSTEASHAPGGAGTRSTYSTIWVDGGGALPRDCNITVSAGPAGVSVPDVSRCLPRYIAPTRFFPKAGTVRVDGSVQEACGTDPETYQPLTATGSFTASDNGISFVDVMDTSLSGPGHRAYFGTASDAEQDIAVASGCKGTTDTASGGVYLLTAKEDGTARAAESKDGLQGTTVGDSGTFQWDFRGEAE